MQPWIKGIDISSLIEVEACGGTFSDQGVPGDALTILKSYGANMVRLRLWNDPYAADGTPYGGGTSDFRKVISLAQRTQAEGMEWLLNFHYSDFWTDPGKQVIPKAWRGLDEAGLADAVYGFTRQTLQTLREQQLTPAIVAVGNEISNGLLWPFGKTPSFNNIVRFLNAGIRAVRETVPEAAIMLHLDDGGNNQLYRQWFDSYFAAGGADFEIIGLSYYPFWQGALSKLSANMNDIAARYHKDLIVVETSTAFTFDDYQVYEQLASAERRGMAAKVSMAEKLEYPATPQGQADYIQALMQVIRDVPDGRGKGFFWWEPAMIPVPGCGWANQAGWEYVNEKGPSGNEWANQALFDYEGRSLPALERIRMFP